MHDPDMRHAFYRAYMKELDSFREHPVKETDDTADRWCDAYLTDSGTAVWIDILDSGGDPAGFLIIGLNAPEKHPDSDYAIAQAYIKPEHRHKGLMTKAVRDFLSVHQGIYALLVLKGNSYAKEFWNRCFVQAGYQSIRLSEECVVNNDDNLILMGFEPGKEQLLLCEASRPHGLCPKNK